MKYVKRMLSLFFALWFATASVLVNAQVYATEENPAEGIEAYELQQDTDGKDPDSKEDPDAKSEEEIEKDSLKDSEKETEEDPEKLQEKEESDSPDSADQEKSEKDGEEAEESDDEEKNEEEEKEPEQISPEEAAKMLLPGLPKFYPDGSVVNSVPRYFQTDYSDIPYGSGSVATSGCTLACIAMVGTYLTGSKISIPDLAERFRNMDGSHVQRMEAIAYMHHLKYTKVLSLYDVVEAAKKGKVSIVMMEKNSYFTSSQHMIVVYGITGDGRLLVHEPNETNYHRSHLVDGFNNGFPQDMLTVGFSGAWVFEPYEEPEYVASRFEGVIQLTDEEKDLIARLIWREARGECYEGQQAVAEVVLNRLVSGRFGKSVKGIIYAEGQFRTAHLLEDTTADAIQFYVLEQALHGKNVLPPDVYFFATRKVNPNYWGQIGKHLFCGAY